METIFGNGHFAIAVASTMSFSLNLEVMALEVHLASLARIADC